MSNKILTISFYILFFFTPIFWTPNNYELFEYNKMMLVYVLTIIITATWLLKMINNKQLIIKRTPLDIPLLLFLLANILSTIFSIDRHISIWGYYSRSNGGLLSLISYLVLYYALVSNFSKEQVLKFLRASILGGVVVSLWAIPEHFGISPSCVILTGEFNASCWVQDVQARVFASLGQPNWLAAYFTMLIFPAIYFALTSISKLYAIRYTLYAILFYLAFTFTYSRGGMLGLLGGLAIFLLSYLCLHLKGVKLKNLFGSVLKPQKSLIVILSIFVLINLVFGSALTNFKLLSKFAPPPRPGLSLPKAPSTTQLESGGSESGQIRLIVWKGAWEVFKHYPIFGSGVETFGLSYYSFRPQEHNLVSEWDFLYNKAHNEFLNYLATTGIVGFASYCIIIITFITAILRKQGTNNLIIYSLLASYISYLIQNIFGFSVVIIALFFYLFPAIAFVTTGSVNEFKLPKKFYILNSIFLIIYRRPFYTKLAKVIVIVIFGSLFWKIANYYFADIYFAKGIHYNETNNSRQAYDYLIAATSLNPNEPFYKSELSFAAAAAAAGLADQDATTSASLKDQAIQEMDEALKISPKNVSFYRTAVRTYYMLSVIDKSYIDKTLDVLDQAINLAPTDAKLVYNKAIILDQEKKIPEAIDALKKTLDLKPNYKEAYLLLGTIYEGQGKKQEALEQAKAVLKFSPGDSDALEKLAAWEK